MTNLFILFFFHLVILALSSGLMVNLNSSDKSWNPETNPNKANGNGVHSELSESTLAIGNWSPAHSVASSPLPVPRLMVSSPQSSAHSSPSRFSLRSSKPLSPYETDSNTDDSPFKKGNEYSSLRIMKQKVLKEFCLFVCFYYYSKKHVSFIFSFSS